MTIQHYVICNSVIHAQYELPEDIIPGLPPKIYEILHHALNKDINERYQSCGEMVAEIENCLYDMNYRPNTKILEQYITSLFEKEHSNEKNRPIEILKCTADEEKTEPEIQIDDKLYQKTRVINQRNEADAKNIKIKKGVIDY